MAASNRRSLDQVREFDSPTKLSESLQQVLMDLIELHLQGKQAHWNLVLMTGNRSELPGSYRGFEIVNPVVA